MFRASFIVGPASGFWRRSCLAFCVLAVCCFSCIVGPARLLLLGDRFRFFGSLRCASCCWGSGNGLASAVFDVIAILGLVVVSLRCGRSTVVLVRFPLSYL